MGIILSVPLKVLVAATIVYGAGIAAPPPLPSTYGFEPFESHIQCEALRFTKCCYNSPTDYSWQCPLGTYGNQICHSVPKDKVGSLCPVKQAESGSSTPFQTNGNCVQHCRWAADDISGLTPQVDEWREQTDQTDLRQKLEDETARADALQDQLHQIADLYLQLEEQKELAIQATRTATDLLRTCEDDLTRALDDRNLPVGPQGNPAELREIVSAKDAEINRLTTAVSELKKVRDEAAAAASQGNTRRACQWRYGGGLACAQNKGDELIYKVGEKVCFRTKSKTGEAGQYVWLPAKITAVDQPEKDQVPNEWTLVVDTFPPTIQTTRYRHQMAPYPKDIP